jgi:coenzyme PQQ synthesis protein D (PqqD)
VNAHSFLRQHPNAAWREIEGEVVVISPEDSVLHELNATASFIWKQSEGAQTLEQIAVRMTEEFEVDRETALQDTVELANHLAGKNLLLVEGGS